MEETSKDVARQSLDKEIMGATHELNQPSQQKPGVEMKLYQEKHYQLGLEKQRKWDEMKEGVQTSWILQDGIIWL